MQNITPPTTDLQRADLARRFGAGFTDAVNDWTATGHLTDPAYVAGHRVGADMRSRGVDTEACRVTGMVSQAQADATFDFLAGVAAKGRCDWCGTGGLIDPSCHCDAEFRALTANLS